MSRAVRAIKIQQPVRAIDEGINPDEIVISGRANIPAPTVVPAIKEAALRTEATPVSSCLFPKLSSFTEPLRGNVLRVNRLNVDD